MSYNPEQLSAGMDGELGDEELRFLLRRLDHDASLQVRWSRFHVAAASLRGELSTMPSANFADRVMRAIEAESAMVAAPRGRRANWLKVSAGGAIAASVAVVALMASRPAGHSIDASRETPSLARLNEQATPSAQLAPVAAPVAVPAWLSNTNAFRYSQQAAFPVGDTISPYEQSLSPYRVNGYRTRQNADGSYLLLIDPTRQSARRSVREAAVAH